MWTSVPQMPVRWMRISTSLIPIFGSGTSSSQSPGPGRLLTMAFMCALSLQAGPQRAPQKGARPLPSRTAASLAQTRRLGLDAGLDAHAVERPTHEEGGRDEEGEGQHVAERRALLRGQVD